MGRLILNLAAIAIGSWLVWIIFHAIAKYGLYNLLPSWFLN